MPFWSSLLTSIIFVLSLSTDAFAASVAYGAGGIYIPRRSAAVISLLCSGMLATALGVGGVLQGFIPASCLRMVCFVLLCGIGVLRLFDSALKQYIRRHQKLHMRFAASNLHFILTVYADAEIADADNSKELSPREAAALAIALSLDGLAVGVGAAMTGIGVALPCTVSVLLTVAALALGCRLGRRIGRVLPFDLSILSALLIILIAIIRFLT